jgi:DnaJ domain
VQIASVSAPPVDLYRALGLAETATPAQVRQAFRTLVRRYHPDANPAAAPGAELSSVVRAYRELGRRGLVPPPSDASGPERPRVDVYA